MKAPFLSAFTLGLLALLGCQPISASADGTDKLPSQLGKVKASGNQIIRELVVGGGCFWCIEAQLEMVKGVKSVESGYAGGDMKDPTYTAVMTGQTGHAEVVKITYDGSQVSTQDLIRIFLIVHDPTQLNRQGPDVGTQYRSVIFFKNDEEKSLAQAVLKEFKDEKVYEKPIVTTLEKLEKFYKAEDYHQDYFAKYEKASDAEKATMNSGYCQYIVKPKVEKMREKLAHLLK